MITARRLQVCLGGLMVAGSAAALAAIVFASSSGVVGATEPGLKSEARREVEKLLAVYERAWNPSDRQRVIDAGRGEATRYGPVLRYILLRPWHQLVLPAIELAAAWEITAATPELVGLATRGPAALRPAALSAADQLAPWPMESLLEFARDPVRSVQIAAFEVAFRREDVPWEQLVDRLVDASPEVRDAAAAVLPAELPPEGAIALGRACERLDAASVASFVRALGAGLDDERTERVVSQLLVEGDDTVAAAALDALAAKAGPLVDARVVQEIADDASRSDDLRTRAVRCLEQTGSGNVDELRDAYGLPPLARYFAARRLLRSGDPTGAEMLIELVEGASEGPRAGVAADALAAEQAARRLLAWLTGVRAAAPARDFHDWLSVQGERIEPRHLPAAPF